MSSISDALKRAQQERDRLRAPGPEGTTPKPPAEHPEASLASVVLRKQAPPPGGTPAAATPTSPVPAITPLADAIRTAPATPPPAVRAQQKAAETIVEDYASKRKLNLPPAMVVYHDRAGPAAEQYRKMRDNLMTANAKREHQVLVITSSVEKEGKTVSLVNLGLSLAEIRINRVLLVDGALHAGGGGRGTLSDILKLRTEPGLAELLVEPDQPIEQCIKATPWHNLFILPAGARTTAPAAAQLLQSQNLRSILRQARASFDWVLIDAPPALALPDAGLLSGASDGILFAVAMHHTPVVQVQTTLRRLKSMNLPVKSCILTRA